MVHDLVEAPEGRELPTHVIKIDENVRREHGASLNGGEQDVRVRPTDVNWQRIAHLNGHGSRREGPKVGHSSCARKKAVYHGNRVRRGSFPEFAVAELMF